MRCICYAHQPIHYRYIYVRMSPSALSVLNNFIKSIAGWDLRHARHHRSRTKATSICLLQYSSHACILCTCFMCARLIHSLYRACKRIIPYISKHELPYQTKIRSGMYTCSSMTLQVLQKKVYPNFLQNLKKKNC